MTLSVPGNEAPAAPAEPRRRRLGEFLIEREIGRGGMGVVLLATQESMGRKVAIKMLPSFAGMDPAAVARFRREAEATGRLSHPGIVPVHAVGEHDGTHYFVMDFVEGPPLNELLDSLRTRPAERLRLSLVEETGLGERFPTMREPGSGTGNAYVRSCARLMADVANALVAAHRERIVHRDLKPNNILIHPAGRPVLVDFGLARDEQALKLTKSGEQVGTPAYMAPEQASGGRSVDARVDIWGLGAVLYELLTLRAPFEGANALDITRHIVEDEPKPVRAHNANVPIDLATILHKCLAKDPDHRYATAKDLEADLRAFLDGRSISARPPSLLMRCKGGLQRRRRALVMTCAAVALGVGVALVAGAIGANADLEHGQAALAEARVQLVQHGNFDGARDLYEKAAALTKQPDQVRLRRLADYRDAFAAHYETHREELQRFCVVFDAKDREQVGDLLQRLEGRGTIVLHDVESAGPVQLFVRRLQDGELAAEWQPYQAGAPLPLDEYLVRAHAAQGQSVTLATRVKRDQAAVLLPRFFEGEQLRPDAAVCFDPQTHTWLAIGRHEVTRGQYRDWLQSLSSDELQAEMTPLGWNGSDKDLDCPVSGLSMHQARAFAALHGAHLPTDRDLWLAGSAGLEGLVYPWGNRFDASRIAADPGTLTRPEPVDMRATGESPLGVRHLLGNVAEMLSPAGEPGLFAGGGHFLTDDPRSLQLIKHSVPLAALREATHQDPNTGMRLCWFLAAADPSLSPGQLQARRDELRQNAKGSALHAWSLSSTGSVTYSLELNASHGGGERTLTVPFVTPGFLQTERCSLAEGPGSPLLIQRRADPGGEAGSLRVALADELRQGERYRILVNADVVPLSGVLPDRDTYVARIPVQSGGPPAAIHTLTLPLASMILETSPPAVQYRDDGRIVLAWEPGEQADTLFVRFRTDGVLGPHWPMRSSVDGHVTRFLEAWNGTGSGLDRLIDPAFTLWPTGKGRASVLADPARRGRLANAKVVDVAMVGDIITVDLVANWDVPDRDGKPFHLAAWPIVLQIRAAAQPRVVRVMPRGGADRGCSSAGGYTHEGLRVRLREFAGTRLRRTQEPPAELQVEMSSPALPGAFVQVVGHYAEVDAQVQMVRFRLSNGANVLRSGVSVSPEHPDGDGWTAMDWRFEQPNGGFAREMWRLGTRGRRHFLVRLVATAASPEEAEKRFDSDSVQQWFAAVMASLT
ncbi:MAG: bifunctional serine/threonine-protein kinase/formylglycine-generating enzyme family protein, partial [Planctomycetota bacterium]